MGSVVTMDGIQGPGYSFKCTFPLIWSRIHRRKEESNSEEF